MCWIFNSLIKSGRLVTDLEWLIIAVNYLLSDLQLLLEAVREFLYRFLIKRPPLSVREYGLVP